MLLRNMRIKIPSAGVYRLYITALILLSVAMAKYSPLYEYLGQEGKASSKPSEMSIDFIWSDMHHDLIGFSVLVLLVVSVLFGLLKPFWRKYPSESPLFVKPLAEPRGVFIELVCLVGLAVVIYALFTYVDSSSYLVPLIGAWIYAIAVLRAVVYVGLCFGRDGVE